MRHPRIFTRLANRLDPNISILDAAMDEIAALEARNAKLEQELTSMAHWQKCADEYEHPMRKAHNIERNE